MTRQESLRDEEIDKLADIADEYMAKSFEETQQEKGNHQSITEVIDALTCGFLDTHDIEPYRNTIIESLTKQTPQKVTHEATLIRDTTCPRCKNVVGSYIDFNGVMKMRSELEIFAKHTIESGGEWRIIDKSGNVGLYESKNKYMLEHNYCYDTPVFQVFNHGKRIFSSTNYYHALKEYRRTIKEEGITD